MHKDVFEKLLNREPDSHKYDYGHVLVAGGSSGMVGAPLLSGMAALRTGAGLVTIAAPAEVTGKLERRVKEIMTLALPDDGSEAAEKIQDFIAERKVSVVVVGPGLAVTEESRILVKELVASVDLPLIVDGGGLGALQNNVDGLDRAKSKAVILTPHQGEFQRLTGQEMPAIRSDLKRIAAGFAENHRCIVVLKGEPTYVARPNGLIYENPTGNPGLATAGTGDVLAGMIAGIVAQGVGSAEAAESAVYLHGLAGDIVADEKTQPGMVASDVVEAIPAALRRVSSLL